MIVIDEFDNIGIKEDAFKNVLKGFSVADLTALLEALKGTMKNEVVIDSRDEIKIDERNPIADALVKIMKYATILEADSDKKEQEDE